jgi:glycosyltransferase involved in cell wall biosynthesis
MNLSRKRILIIQPSLQPPGGGNNVAAWTIEALKREYRLTVLTWTPIDLAEINRYFGTSLVASDFDALLPNLGLRRPLDAIPLPLSLLKMNILLRLAKRAQRDFDLLMTVNNEADFGSAGIQYVHFPALQRPRPKTDLRWYHSWKPLLHSYYRSCERISNFSLGRSKSNLTLVNSRWTGGRLHECHGIGSTVLYPPVSGDFSAVPWERREDGFVCIGRFSPEKKIDNVIGIVGALRTQGRDVHLHFIGGRDAGFGAYYREIRGLAAANASWIFVHENISRAELVDLIARHRYGIHGMEEEHFGMAVAEMARAGCIVFVPRGGGQVEIVGEDERLVYDGREDAVRKIAHAMANAETQTALREFLARRSALFTAERFMDGFREIVRQFLSAHDVGRPSTR